MVEPTILKAVQGVEKGHVQEANHLANGINGKQTNDHTLESTQQLCSSRPDHSLCLFSPLVVA